MKHIRGDRNWIKILCLIILVNICISSISANSTVIDFSDKLNINTYIPNAKWTTSTLPDGEKVGEIEFFHKGNELPNDTTIWFRNGALLYDFNIIELILTTWGENPCQVQLVVRDNKKRIYNFPMKSFITGNKIIYSSNIDSQMAYPCVINQKPTKSKIELPLQLLNVNIKGDGNKIYFSTLQQFERGVFFTLDTGKTVGVWSTDSKISPSLILSNNTSSAQNVTYEYSIQDPGSLKYDFKKEAISMQSGDKKYIHLKRPECSGVYSISYSFDDGKRTYHHKKTFAAMKPAKNSNIKVGFDLGVCAHLARYSHSDNLKMLNLLKLCGASHVRVSSLWRTLNPRKGEWNFEYSDWLFQKCNQLEIEPVAIMGIGPDYAAATNYPQKKGKGRIPLPKFEIYQEWIQRFAERYKDYIHQYGVWNEPELECFADFASSEYIKLQKIAYNTLKSIDKNNIVFAGGFAGIPFCTEMLHLLAKEPEQTSDYISIHIHDSPNIFTKKLKNFLDLCKSLNLKQPFITDECGFGTSDDMLQVKALFQKAIQFRVEGAKSFFWYTLRNCGTNKTDSEDNYGLVDYELNPRPSYVVYNMLSSFYQNSKFIKKENWNPDIYAARFESENSALFPIWVNRKSQENTSIVLSTDAIKANRIDLFGNIYPVKIEGGKIIFEINAIGQSLQLYPAKAKLSWQGETITLQDKLYFSPNEPKDIVFKLNEHLHQKGFSAEMITPKGLSVINSKTEGGKLVLTVVASEDFNLKKIKSPAVTIQQYLNNTKLHKPLIFRMPPIFYLKKYSRITSVGSINRLSQTRFMLPYSPEYAELFWKGQKDCAIYFAVATGKDNSLQFQIGQDDDIHVQNFSAQDMWKGDSIQVLLKFPQQSGFWNIGVAMKNNGELIKHIWNNPKGIDINRALDGIRVTGVEQDHSHNFYINLKLDSFGTSINKLNEGVYFNIIANDNDGKLRESQLSFMENMKNLPEEWLTADTPMLLVK